MRRRGVTGGPHWRTTLVAGLRASDPAAPWPIDGATDGAAFRTCVERVPAPEPRCGEVVVTDDPGAHEVPGVRDAIRAVGAGLLSLPPCSPDP